MADIKVSQLPAVSSTQGTDTHMVVQGGVSKKITTSQLLSTTVRPVATIAELRGTSVGYTNQQVQLAGHTSEGAGGGSFRGVSGAAASTYVDDDATVIVPTGGDGSAAWLREDSILTPQMCGGETITAMNAATIIAGDDGIYAPAGDYSSSEGLNPGETGSIVISGQGETTVIEKTAGVSVGPVYSFQGRTKLLLSKLKALLLPDATATNSSNLFNWSHNDIVLDGVTADGGVVIDTEGNRNTVNNVALVQTGDRSNLQIFRSKFTRFFWGFLKSNTTVSTETDITVAFSEFDEFGGTYMLFNSPAAGSKIENVLVIGNKLGSVLSKQPFGSPIGFPHRGSFAGHVEYARLIGNHATGYGGEFFRSEEAARGIIMLGNTAKLDGKDGIEIIPNDAGGTLYTPQMFIVADNVLDHRGLVSSPTLGYGIGLMSYPSVIGKHDSVTESTVHDNVIGGFDSGMYLMYGMHRNIIHHNVLTNCAKGLLVTTPTLGFKDNLIVDCPISILSDSDQVLEEGGLLGKNHFRSTVDPPVAVEVDGTNAPLGLCGWTFETGELSIPNGAASYPIINLGAKFNGVITLSLTRSKFGYSFIRANVNWDGTTLTVTETLRSAPGATVISATALEAVGGYLNVRTFNSDVAKDYRLAVDFDGLHVFI